MKHVLFFILLICLFAVATACGNIPPEKDYDVVSWETSNTVPEVTNDNSQDSTVLESQLIQPIETELPAKETVIHTDYGKFVLSGHWQGELIVEYLRGQSNTIRALCQTERHGKIHLFDVIFGVADGDLVGYVFYAPRNEYISVCLKLSAVEPDDSWTEEEKQEFYGMQSEVNSILSQLDLVSETPAEPTQEDDVVEVKTSYFSLYYPAKFAGCIRAEVQEGEIVVVSFFGTAVGMEEQHLYDIEINSATEIPVGYYTLSDGKNIALDICNFAEYSMEGWADEPQKQMNEMIESVNDVLFALEQSGNFTYY